MKEEKKAEKATVMEDFDYLGGGDLTGFEAMTVDTMSFPFLRVLQDLSPQVKKTSSQYNANVDAGDFYNSLMDKGYGPSIRVVVGKFERKYLKWKPDRGGYLGAFEPEYVLDLQQKGDLSPSEKGLNWVDFEGNIYQETFTYYVLPVDHATDGILVFPCASSFIKEAKRWNRLMATLTLPNGQLAMPYHGIWRLHSAIQQKGKDEWFTFSVQFDSFVTRQQYAVVSKERAALTESTKTVNYAELEAGEDHERTAIAAASPADDIPF